MSRFGTVLLFGCLLTASGCGTTHYYLPPRPLDSDESAVYLTWHYDLRGLNAPNPVPDFHFYYGVGQEINLGLGVSLPIFITHVSGVKYWPVGEDCRYAFLHFGQVAGTNMNPFAEAGYGYSLQGASVVQQFEAGLAYGNGTAAPLAMGAMGSEYGGGNRLIPLAKYQITGEDAGASVQYYHGMTATHLRNLERVASQGWTGPDKHIRAAEVDSVAFYAQPVSNAGSDHAIIFMGSGWQYDLFATDGGAIEVQQKLPPTVGDIVIWPANEWPRIEGQLPEFPPDSLPALYFRAFTQIARGAEFVTPDEPFIGRVDSIAVALQRGEDVTLRTYRDVQADILRQWQVGRRWFWNDLSVGAAVIDFSKD